VNYSELVDKFTDEFYEFSNSNPQYKLKSYVKILEQNGIKWDSEEMRGADISLLGEDCVLALIMGAIRAERFCDGALLGFIKDGTITNWLKRLKDIDFQADKKQLTDVYFMYGGFFDGYTNYHITFGENETNMTEFNQLRNENPMSKILKISTGDFKALHMEYWASEYRDPGILDGCQWWLIVCYKNVRPLRIYGSNAYPENWKELLKLINNDNK
jgi:hypothetical protein